MSNSNSSKNLKPFKKGQSGNPKGRPKLPDIGKLIGKVLSEKQEGGQSLAEEILRQGALKAAKGDARWAEIILSRAYGKPLQPINHSGKIEDGKEPPRRDLSMLTDQELEIMSAIEDKIRKGNE